MLGNASANDRANLIWFTKSEDRWLKWVSLGERHLEIEIHRERVWA